MSDTPETDKEWRHPASFDGSERVVHISVAQKRERERDEAREELEEEKKFHNRTHSELVQTQCKLMDLTKTIIDTLEENRHLADGDDCKLAKLKSAVPEWK